MTTYFKRTTYSPEAGVSDSHLLEGEDLGPLQAPPSRSSPKLLSMQVMDSFRAHSSAPWPCVGLCGRVRHPARASMSPPLGPTSYGNTDLASFIRTIQPHVPAMSNCRNSLVEPRRRDRASGAGPCGWSPTPNASAYCREKHQQELSNGSAKASGA